MGMALPVVPPMMLVVSEALQQALGREAPGGSRGRGSGGGVDDGPVFHVRGLTLSEEYSRMQTVLRMPGSNPFAVRQELVRVGPTHCRVTGILCVFGLPRLLTGGWAGWLGGVGGGGGEARPSQLA